MIGDVQSGQTTFGRDILVELADFLLANRDEITRLWVVAVDRSKEIQSSEDLTYTQLLDHLPQLSVELAEILKNPASEMNWNEAARDSGRHGKKRWDQGYNLEELIREVCLIRRKFLDHWLSAFREKQPSFEGEPKRAAKKIIHRFFDDLVVESVTQFVDEQQQHAREIQIELVQQTERAQAAREAKDRFLALISHELRTPLTPVLLEASALLVDPELSPKMRGSLETISHNTKIEANHVDDLLDAARLTEGRLALVAEEVDVQACVQEAVSACRRDFLAKELKLSVRIQATRSTLKGDRARLVRAFAALLRNAASVSHHGGPVEVITGNPETGDAFEISIQDSGSVMDAEQLSRLFMPFEEGRRSAFGAGGFGLNRYVCKGIVEAHGGRVTVAPVSPSGAIFVITLPLSQPSE
jgi:signal transduction histidine kinase